MHSRVSVPALLVAVVNIVDSEPHREQRIAARPRGRRRPLRCPTLEVIHLLDEVARVERRRHKRRVDRRAADGVVVRQDERPVVLHRVEVDPVRTDARRARVRRVSERVARGGLSACHIEPAGSVRVAAAFPLVVSACIRRYR